jgi:GNAT superfamily N-acetyltransferase
MNSALSIRNLTAEDLPFAHELRSIIGWNQTLADWRMLLELQPNGCFLAEWEGQRVGTVTTTIYSDELAWIGMMLVHPTYRGRGIGKALMSTAIEFLKGSDVACIGLDATPAGRELYLKLGFKEEWSITRWSRTTRSIAVVQPSDSFEAPETNNWISKIGDLDIEAFGVLRAPLLSRLATLATASVVVRDEQGPEAFGFIRPGSNASYLGPVVAQNAALAQGVIEQLLTQAEAVIWDIPDPNEHARGWAAKHGFQPVRSLARMTIGTRARVARPLHQYALAGPELG